jgi:hypothetical protein
MATGDDCNCRCTTHNYDNWHNRTTATTYSFREEHHLISFPISKLIENQGRVVSVDVQASG